jgi:hypothetical protein
VQGVGPPLTAQGFLASPDAIKMREAMNNDNPSGQLQSLRAEHRSLDERIEQLSAEPIGDQLEIARLKRRKLMLKDQIQRIVDTNIPDIIA